MWCRTADWLRGPAEACHDYIVRAVTGGGAPSLEIMAAQPIWSVCRPPRKIHRLLIILRRNNLNDAQPPTHRPATNIRARTFLTIIFLCHAESKYESNLFLDAINRFSGTSFPKRIIYSQRLFTHEPHQAREYSKPAFVRGSNGGSIERKWLAEVHRVRGSPFVGMRCPRVQGYLSQASFATRAVVFIATVLRDAV